MSSIAPTNSSLAGTARRKASSYRHPRSAHLRRCAAERSSRGRPDAPRGRQRARLRWYRGRRRV